MRTLVTAEGTQAEPSVEQVRDRIASGRGGYWLDIESPAEADYALLLDGFAFHQLTVEDIREQNQRPKLDQFPGYAFAVLFSAACEGDEVTFREYHLYLTNDVVVTVHQEPAPELAALRQRIREETDLTRGQIGFVRYLVISELVESMFPVLDQLDETIDQLVDGIIVRATSQTLARITRLKHEVVDLRRVLGPQRDVFQRLLTHSLDHENNELSLYWRDVYEHLVRQYEQVDSLRDLLTGAMDVYLSTVSNRLNTTVKQLTVIASLFLPLTFLAGFFGMNFGALVQSLASVTALAIGIVLMVVSTLVQLYLFRRQGWI
jgi:magnesium transporter